MNRLTILTSVAVAIIIICFSCYYDNEEALYPTAGTTVCDTLNVTFAGTVSTILANNCLSCHSNATAASSGNGIRLQDYADVKARAAAVVGSIKHTGIYSPMPKNGGTLKACSITQFDIWVRKGMINN